MSRVWTAILLAGAGTYAMRASFIVAARRLATVPPWADRILRQIPPAALAALIVPSLVRIDGELDLWQPRLAIGVLAGLVAWRTRNVAVTLVVGIAGLMALEAIV
ncbi:AzlD domain-containing protein [Actinomarinicola tropica]|uniref:AzlD domain-containing protein n=1 Tax=Actinomarinicola tropica TaxID=2789776 RepID=A0A5Q2RM36_9ACTN|nr:AzlD domain-containing protein [Actinomarinicola tropica]QGG95631.1 AzlD domain-containing protein [Actinomarinicola tropica]